jgi:hypothetical protein
MTIKLFFTKKIPLSFPQKFPQKRPSVQDQNMLSSAFSRYSLPWYKLALIALVGAVFAWSAMSQSRRNARYYRRTGRQPKPIFKRGKGRKGARIRKRRSRGPLL